MSIVFARNPQLGLLAVGITRVVKPSYAFIIITAIGFLYGTALA